MSAKRPSASCSIGCGTLAMAYFNFDMIVSAHGRAPAAVATGYKRCRPDNVVFIYQGDGDLARDRPGGDHALCQSWRTDHHHLL